MLPIRHWMELNGARFFREGLYTRSMFALPAAFSFPRLCVPYLSMPRELETRPSPSHHILM